MDGSPAAAAVHRQGTSRGPFGVVEIEIKSPRESWSIRCNSVTGLFTSGYRPTSFDADRYFLLRVIIWVVDCCCSSLDNGGAATHTTRKIWKFFFSPTGPCYRPRWFVNDTLNTLTHRHKHFWQNEGRKSSRTEPDWMAPDWLKRLHLNRETKWMAGSLFDWVTRGRSALVTVSFT